LNRGHEDFQSSALPTELSRQELCFRIFWWWSLAPNYPLVSQRIFYHIQGIPQAQI